MKKILAATVAVSGLIALAAPANAAVTASTAVRYVSGTSAPTATTAFAGPATLVFDATGAAAWQSAFTSGNTVTYTLSQGTFAVLPTIAIANGGTVSYVSGGAGSNFITYQLGGATTATTALTLTGVQVNGVTSVSGGSTINVSLSDGANALTGVNATDKRFSVATFTDPYAINVTPFAQGTALVDLSATAPGSRYTTSPATLGTITVSPATGGALVNWAGATLTAAAAATSSLALTIPGTPFVSAVIGGTCTTGGTGLTVTSAPSNVVTFSGTQLANVAAPGGASCEIELALTNPTTGTTLLSAGPTSAVLTLALGGVTTSNVTGITRTFSQTTTPVTYSGGSVVNAGYTVGADANYDFFVNVSNGNTAGPVIVTASVGGSTGTAVLTNSLAANSSEIYSIAAIKAALEAAGMPAATFADATSRGQLQVVVPTNARVTPLLQNKVNGQVVEISRQ